MRTTPVSLLLLSFALALPALSAVGSDPAGPTLDDMLNYAVVDQRCPAESVKEEGMGLVTQGKAQFVALTAQQPLGQTFTLGPTADILWRVCVGICHWSDSWQEGEEVTFTLWDSPEKNVRLYSRTIGFDHKWFKWDVVFDTHLQVQPDTQYYFELTHNGAGDNTINVAYIARDEYPRGRAYVAGEPQDFDLYFVAVTKPKPDREANLRRFLGRFDLDHPMLAAAKAAFEKGELDGACTEILNAVDSHMRAADWLWRPDRDQPHDTSSMDAVTDESRLYDEHKNAWIEMSVRTTWREVWPGTSSYPRMNDIFAGLGHAYYVTGDEKYARKLNELMADYEQDNASPFEGGMRGGRWVAMFQAWRLGDAWDGYGCAIDSKGLTRDVRLGWLDYWARMAHFAITEPSGGNHANAVAEALMKFASRFPMFADSKKWFEGGFDLLVSNSVKLFRDDGGCVEPAMNYHGFSLANLMAGLETARGFGLEPPPEILTTLENALAYTAYMLKPDGQIPSYGDTNCEEFRPNIKKWDGWRKGEAADGARLFGRSDLLYISTAGERGSRPSSDSYCFPQTGHYILRSDWGSENGEGFEDARYLFLRAGRQGSHGHDDMNMITLYAHGRPLIIDPGRTTYGTPLMFELSKNRSHSVLLVDDIEQMNRVGATIHAWNTTPVMDLVDSEYVDLYPGVSHRRAIVFVRPNYYVMFDSAVGSGPHRYGINFWLTPPDPIIDAAGGLVCTTEPEGANILLRCIGDGQVGLDSRHGTLDHAKKIWDQIPVVTFTQSGRETAGFVTVLYPFPGAADPDSVTVKPISVQGGRGVIVESPDGRDIVFYSTDSCRAELPRGAAAFAGRAGLARVSDNSFAMIDATLMALGGRTLASSDQPVEELSVRYLADLVEVNCPKPEPSLRVASLGRKAAVVNGTNVQVDGDTFAPFGR